MTLTVAGVTKRFGPTQALRDAGFTASAGELLGVIGPNGSGKSTLLACAAGLVAADEGTVVIDEVVLDLPAIRTSIFLLPDGITPWAEHRVRDVFGFWRTLQRRSLDATRRRIDDVSLGALLGRRVGELSKGERKRLMLVLALLAPQPILLLDEPFDGLDLRQMRDVARLLRDEAQAGRTLVVSLHQLGDAQRVCDRLALAELRAIAGLPGAALDEVFLALV
jgi:ABC-2 type transport system ATP-binding protein